MPSPATKKRRTRKPRRDYSGQPRFQVQRYVRNTKLLLPRVDRAAVLCGDKTEWRIYGKLPPIEQALPSPCVVYTPQPHDPTAYPDTAVVMLEERWYEPLGAISPESLEREGFADIGEFRRYFAARYPNGGYRPMANVIVQRVRVMVPEDRAVFAERLFDFLYGDFA